MWVWLCMTAQIVSTSTAPAFHTFPFLTPPSGPLHSDQRAYRAYKVHRGHQAFLYGFLLSFFFFFKSVGNWGGGKSRPSRLPPSSLGFAVFPTSPRRSFSPVAGLPAPDPSPSSQLPRRTWQKGVLSPAVAYGPRPSSSGILGAVKFFKSTFSLIKVTFLPAVILIWLCIAPVTLSFRSPSCTWQEAQSRPAGFNSGDRNTLT